MTEEHEPAEDRRERPSTGADRRGRRSESVPAGGGKGRVTPVRDGRGTKPSVVHRIVRFLREVVAELHKVIWPTRKQLVTYTIVVLVFVSFMVTLVAGLDLAFHEGVRFLFGV